MNRLRFSWFLQKQFYSLNYLLMRSSCYSYCSLFFTSGPEHLQRVCRSFQEPSDFQTWRNAIIVSVSCADTFAEMKVSGEDWLLANLNTVGYYRVNYDAANWDRLLEVLRTNYLVRVRHQSL